MVPTMTTTPTTIKHRKEIRCVHSRCLPLSAPIPGTRLNLWHHIKTFYPIRRSIFHNTKRYFVLTQNISNWKVSFIPVSVSAAICFWPALCNTEYGVYSERKAIEGMPKFMLSFFFSSRKHKCRKRERDDRERERGGESERTKKFTEQERYTQTDYHVVNIDFLLDVCSKLFLIITNAMNNENDASKPCSFHPCQSDSINTHTPYWWNEQKRKKHRVCFSPNSIVNSTVTICAVI